MNCFYCRKPVPGDCALRERVYSRSDLWEMIEGKCRREDFPELCFHPACAKQFAFSILRSLLRHERRCKGLRRQKLYYLLQTLMDDWNPLEPDYAKPKWLTKNL